MNMFNTISVIGGDLRQIALAHLLEKKGCNVQIFGFDKNIEVGTLKKAHTLADAAKAAAIVLPLPVSQDNITLNAPLSINEIKLGELAKAAPKNSLVFGGKFSAAAREFFRGIRVYDYLDREELSVLNAIPTAEGAIEIALAETPRTIHSSKCLVIGYGRIGKVLADRLGAFGAEVVVSARKAEDFSWISANGFESVNSLELEKERFDYNIIFNTVPSVILNAAVLEKIPKDTLIIDLASKPGGVDFSLARELGLKVIWALSLPGKTAPITAGEIIGNTILNILKESEGI